MKLGTQRRIDSVSVVCAAWLATVGCAHENASVKTAGLAETPDDLVGACRPDPTAAPCPEQLAQLKELLGHFTGQESLFALATDVRRGGSGGLKAESARAVRAVLAQPVVASHFDAIADVDRQLLQYDKSDPVWRASDPAQLVFADLTVNRSLAVAHATDELRHHLDALVSRLDWLTKPQPRPVATH